MIESDFYITLPSNSKSFPDNTLANFGILLPRRIHLLGEWYVGLTEISFTKSWLTVSEPLNLAYSFKGGHFEFDKKLQPAYYNSADKLLRKLRQHYETIVDPINEKLVPALEISPSGIVTIKPIQIEDIHSAQIKHKIINSTSEYTTYSKNDEESSTEIAAFNVYPRLGEEISGILGLPWPLPTDNKFYNRTEAKIKGFRPVDIKAGKHSLFIYSNIVEPSIVGDSEVQFLRAVRVPEEASYGQQCNVIFNQPYYFKAHQHEFQTIFVNIKDDTGKEIPFNFGRVIVTLHFKKWTSII